MKEGDELIGDAIRPVKTERINARTDQAGKESIVVLLEDVDKD